MYCFDIYLDSTWVHGLSWVTMRSLSSFSGFVGWLRSKKEKSFMGLSQGQNLGYEEESGGGGSTSTMTEAAFFIDDDR